MFKIKEVDDKQNSLPLSMRQELTSIEREYNRIRHTLYAKTQIYYRQSIGSDYITEDDICELAAECKKLKIEYRKVQKVLMEQKELPMIIEFQNGKLHRKR